MLEYRLTTRPDRNAISSRFAGQYLKKLTLPAVSRAMIKSAVRCYSSMRAALPSFDFTMSLEIPTLILDVLFCFLKCGRGCAGSY
jgi:hypothetical protein